MALAYKKKTVIPAIWCRSGVLAAIMCVNDQNQRQNQRGQCRSMEVRVDHSTLTLLIKAVVIVLSIREVGFTSSNVSFVIPAQAGQKREAC